MEYNVVHITTVYEQFLTQKVWARVLEFAFLASSQMVLTLSSRNHTSENQSSKVILPQS